MSSTNPVYYARYIAPALMAARALKRSYSSIAGPVAPAVYRLSQRSRRYVSTYYNKRHRARKPVGQLDYGVRSGGLQTFLRLPNGFGFADRYMCNDSLLYQNETIAAGGAQNYIFWANSVYQSDPNSQNSRHYARLANVYRAYKVVAGAIRVTVVNADDSHPVNVIVTPSEDGSPGSTEELASCNPLARSTIVTQYAGKEIIHHYCNFKALVGQKFADQNYTQLIGARPTSGIYWHVQLFGDTSTPTALACHIYIYITYTTIWSGREITT